MFAKQVALLGWKDEDGKKFYVKDQTWVETNNGNPANMLEFIRFLYGENAMFICERSNSRNTVVYQFDEHLLEFKCFRINIPPYTNLSEIIDLQKIEFSCLDKSVYGVRTTANSDVFSIKAVPQFMLKRKKINGVWRTFITIQENIWMLQRIMLQIKENTMLPVVTHMMLEVSRALDTPVFRFHYKID